MSLRIFKIVALFIMLGVALYPVVESFDTWDEPGPSNDIELKFVSIAMGIGLLLCLSRILVFRSFRRQPRPTLKPDVVAFSPLEVLVWELPASHAPPVPLRI